MIASGFGINAKLVASVRPDPRTGQLTMIVTDLPQVPFDEFNLHIFASDRSLAATPTRCAVYNADSIFIPWNDRLSPQHSMPAINIDSGPGGSPCPGVIRPFEPRLVAGMSNPLAGAFSNFTLRLDRDDGDQFLGDLGFTMPPGLTGSLRGISYCPDPSIVAAAETLGRAEQAPRAVRAPRRSARRTSRPAPGATRSTPSARCIWPGPSRGRR